MDKTTKNQYCCLILLLLVLLFLNLFSIHHKSLTYDEDDHYQYGMKILNGEPARVRKWDDSKMPFSAFNALPGKMAEFLEPGRIKDFFVQIKTGRFITILFSLLLAIYVFKWSKDLYGPLAGCFSLLLYTFSPNIIAHSRLVTTDLYAALAVTISSYYFWRFLNNGGWKAALISALTLGLSQLAKYSSIYLYPIFILIILIRSIPVGVRLAQKHNMNNILKSLRRLFFIVIFFAAVSIFVINLGFLFYHSGTPLSEYKFKSNLLKTIQVKCKTLFPLPVYLPYPFLQGLDMVKYHEDTNRSFENIYLLGEIRRGQGFKGYYFYVFLYKIPLAMQILVILSIVSYLVHKRKYHFLRDELFLWAPIIFYTIYYNFFFKAQIGIRFLIVILPFLYIFCGSLFRTIKTGSMWLRTLHISLLAWLVISVLSYFPHYISYFNELVWDRKQAYKILADSNIDWGQNNWYLEQYIRNHPGAHVNPMNPTTGRIVVNVNRLVGVYKPKRYRWLRNNHKPVDHIAYSYLVYDIPAEAKENER